MKRNIKMKNIISQKSASDFWEMSKDALEKGNIQKAADMAFHARKIEYETIGKSFDENSIFGNPLFAISLATEAKSIEIPIKDLPNEKKSKIQTEVAFGLLKGENRVQIERHLREDLEDFEWIEFENLCDIFENLNQWPPTWGVIKQFYEIQKYPIESLLYEMKKYELLKLAEKYSADVKPRYLKSTIIKSLKRKIPMEDKEKILELVNIKWKHKYLQAKRSTFTGMIAIRSQKLAELQGYKSLQKIIGEEIKVQWWSACDGRECSVCASRHGKIYTLEEASKILIPPCLGCRCCFLPYTEVLAAARKKFPTKNQV